MTDTTPKVPETHPISKKYPLPIMVVMMVVLMIAIGIGMYKKTSSDSNSNAKTDVVKTPVNLAEIQRRLGPEWRMIVLGPGETFGPKKLKNGTGWEVAKGEIWVKVNNEKPFLDQPDNKHRTVGGGKIFFSNTSRDEAIFFFKS